MKKINIFKKNINLAKFTTFKIGGSAEFFVEVASINELVEAILWAERENIKFTLIGGGSNILINDKGVSGLVIKIDIDYIKIDQNKLEVGAGVFFSQAVTLAFENSFSGLEWAVGIPGFIGGAVRGNAGAFGSATGDTIDKVIVYDVNEKAIVEYTKNACSFNYRSSIFKLRNNLIVLKAIFKLKKEKKSIIKEIMDKNSKIRILNRPKGKTAGSIFKNVQVSELLAYNSSLLTKAAKEKVIRGKMIPAGWIIDQAGLRGRIIGGAKISDEHANVIINWQQAASDDVIRLISLVKTKVRNKLKVQLSEEIEYIGF
jgi:UDP-N-acetylmuramate dehydrogenase